MITPEAHGAVGDGVTDDRLAIQAAIDAAALANDTLMFDSNKTYLICLPHGVSTPLNCFGIKLKTNTKIISSGAKRAVLKFLPPKDGSGNFSLKTQNFTGGVAIDVSQVCAVMIDNISSPGTSNIKVSGIHFTTDLVKWYNANEFLTMVPVWMYLQNTGVENDFYDPAKDVSGFSFEDCMVSNFKRGTISARGRRLNNFVFKNCHFYKIAEHDLELPSEALKIHKEILVTGLAPSTTQYNFNITDGFDFAVILYGATGAPIGMIPWIGGTAFADPAIGSISGNPSVSGLLQWSLGTMSASTTSISVLAVRRFNQTAGGAQINGVCIDVSNARDLTIKDCIFEDSGADSYDHYIYLTRVVENCVIENNFFIGRKETRFQAGGGVHIRGSAYKNFIIKNNHFLNTKDGDINISSYSNFLIEGNEFLMDYTCSLGAPSMLFFNWGAGDNVLLKNNIVKSVHSFYAPQPFAAYSGVGLTAKNIRIDGNIFVGVSLQTPIGTNLVVSNNYFKSTDKSESSTAHILVIHNNVNDALNVQYINNEFDLGLANISSPVVEGFSKFLWRGNRFTTNINMFRAGSTFRLKDVVFEDCEINNLRLYTDGSCSIRNFKGIVSYVSQSEYNVIVQTKTLGCYNCTELASTPRSIVANQLAVIDTDRVSVDAAAPGNVEFLDVRVLRNHNGYILDLFNMSAHTITFVDISTATHTNKNIDNGGSNVAVLANQTIRFRLDKTNARWKVVSVV